MSEKEAVDRESELRTGGSMPAVIDLQGHRGARGLMPENSIPGFRLALELGVTTLEMDTVISRDLRVVVSHDPWMSSTICRTPDGRPISRVSQRTHRIFALTYDEIARYDCGSWGNPAFPKQQRISVCKPLLDEVLTDAERYAEQLGRPAPYYNIEIKSRPEYDNVFHPPVDIFAQLLIDVVKAHGVAERTTIQSFDPRALRAVRNLDTPVSLSLLVDNRAGFERNVHRLGFLPDIYSPRARLVDATLAAAVQHAGIRLLPWTINHPRMMLRLLRLGVDGFITDYPDIGRDIVDDFVAEKHGKM